MCVRAVVAVLIVVRCTRGCLSDCERGNRSQYRLPFVYSSSCPPNVRAMECCEVLEVLLGFGEMRCMALLGFMSS